MVSQTIGLSSSLLFILAAIGSSGFEAGVPLSPKRLRTWASGDVSLA